MQLVLVWFMLSPPIAILFKLVLAIAIYCDIMYPLFPCMQVGTAGSSAPAVIQRWRC